MGERRDSNGEDPTPNGLGIICLIMFGVLLGLITLVVYVSMEDQPQRVLTPVLLPLPLLTLLVLRLVHQRLTRYWNAYILSIACGYLGVMVIAYAEHVI